MEIEIKKGTPYRCVYALIRADGTTELITLETKTYLLHDICHYVVERQLQYANGFWGMLAAGFSFKDLFGKDNPQTAALMAIEQIVGPIQAVYSGHILPQDFPQFVAHLQFQITNDMLEACLQSIEVIMKRWKELSVGEALTLEWRF